MTFWCFAYQSKGMKRTKEEAAETRQAILEAAERLFLEAGYENVTLDHIAF